jgi:hypothetical protein
MTPHWFNRVSSHRQQFSPLLCGYRSVWPKRDTGSAIALLDPESYFDRRLIAFRNPVTELEDGGKRLITRG